MPMAEASERGFKTQGGEACEVAYLIVVEYVHKFGDENPVISCFDAHRQFVAKVARSRVTHAGHTQMLAQSSGRLDIEIVKRDNSINRVGARQITCALD
jgi:hypothetical protein